LRTSVLSVSDEKEKKNFGAREIGHVLRFLFVDLKISAPSIFSLLPPHMEVILRGERKAVQRWTQVVVLLEKVLLHCPPCKDCTCLNATTLSVEGYQGRNPLAPFYFNTSPRGNSRPVATRDI
jgi:hypothetical protein